VIILLPIRNSSGLRKSLTIVHCQHASCLQIKGIPPAPRSVIDCSVVPLGFYLSLLLVPGPDLSLPFFLTTLSPVFPWEALLPMRRRVRTFSVLPYHLFSPLPHRHGCSVSLFFSPPHAVPQSLPVNPDCRPFGIPETQCASPSCVFHFLSFAPFSPPCLIFNVFSPHFF